MVGTYGLTSAEIGADLRTLTSMEHPNVLTTETFKPLLKILVQDPKSFTPELATISFEHLASGPSSASEAQVASFLTALTISGLDQKAEIVAAAAHVMRRYSIPVNLDLGDQATEGLVVDIVGTGGDGHDTFNVSTSAGIVAAGAGAIVCKVSH